MRTIAVLNQKGGVGKTTTTVNTAAALATMGQRVAVIDLDPQAHLTIHLGIEPQEIEAGSYEVLTQSAAFEESLMMVRPNLWALAANINLVGAETELVSVVGREIILREAMHASEDRFDFCLIDCAPSLGLLSLNALAAAQEVLIPLQPHFLALQGFGKLLQTVDLVSKRINRDLKVTGVLLCMFDTRASLPNEVRADIERFLENARGSANAWADAQLLPTYIRRNIKLAEAPSYGRTIFEYDPTCNGAEDYKRVGQFFLGIEPEPQTQPVGTNNHSPFSEPGTEPESVETRDVVPPPPSEPESIPPSAAEPERQPEPPTMADADATIDAGEPGDLSEHQNPLATVNAEPEPAETESLASEPSPEFEMARDVATDSGASADDADVDCDLENEGLRLPPVAEAAAPLESEIATETSQAVPPGETGASENEGQAQADGTYPGPGPIEIREIHPAGPRRYTPPPLQRYPTAPSDGAPRDDDVPGDTPKPPNEHPQGESQPPA